MGWLKRLASRILRPVTTTMGCLKSLASRIFRPVTTTMGCLKSLVPRILIPELNTMGCLKGLIPRILLPDFTWPHHVLGSEPLAQEIPAVPKPPHPFIRLLCGYIHSGLYRFSIRYCRWCGIRFNRLASPLPFGLVLKSTERVRLEEFLATQVVRAAGFPVPKMISMGELPSGPFPNSFLMTRIPGKMLWEVYNDLTEDTRKVIFSELQIMIDTMQSWTNPWGNEKICSISGTSIRSHRVPEREVGPCNNEKEFNDYIMSYACDDCNRPTYEQHLASATKIEMIPHKIGFGHGDLAHHNILIHDGHISGLIDWETAGWYPNYWDWTTSIKWLSKKCWWYEHMFEIGLKNYERELEYERDRLVVTSGSWNP